jgi:2-haloacid dehalogenase
MIAAHGWDLAGASHGLAILLLVKGNHTLSSKPDFVANDILAMAEKLVATYTE